MVQTIALVDDDRNILTSISMALEKEGFKVQTYIDAETALVGIARISGGTIYLNPALITTSGESLATSAKSRLSVINATISSPCAMSQS